MNLFPEMTPEQRFAASSKGGKKTKARWGVKRCDKCGHVLAPSPYFRKIGLSGGSKGAKGLRAKFASDEDYREYMRGLGRKGGRPRLQPLPGAKDCANSGPTVR